MENEGAPDLIEEDSMSLATAGDISKSFKNLDELLCCRSQRQRKNPAHVSYYANLIDYATANPIACLPTLKMKHMLFRKRWKRPILINLQGNE